MNKKIFIAMAVLGLAAMACGINTNVPTPSSIPNANPTAGSGAITTGTVLFQDNFADPNSGWGHSSTADGTTDYQYGGYRINVTAANTYLWANPAQSLQNDVIVEVDATKQGGPDDNAFGVMCRYQDTNNFYKFYLSSDGYAGIVKIENGTSTVISAADGQLHTVNGVNQGQATNHIRADCIGTTVTLYANGNQVATATDSTFTNGGDVGLAAAAYATSGTDILFTNFLVSKP